MHLKLNAAVWYSLLVCMSHAADERFMHTAVADDACGFALRSQHSSAPLTLSSMLQVDAGLDALQAALKAGFEQYGKIRTDPNLEKVRTSPRFEPMVDQYDEPVISRGAIRYVLSAVGFLL